MIAATDPIHLRPAPRFPAKFVLGVVVLSLLSALTTWLSATYTRFDGGVASLCLANGLLTGVLLVSPRATWRWYFAAAGVGQLLARFALDGSWPQAVAIALINLLESGIVAWWVLRRVDDQHQENRLGGMALAALASTLVACLVSATLALPWLTIRVATSPEVTWFSWVTAHSLGMMLVGTLTVCALQPRVGLWGRKGRRVDFGLCVSLLLITCYVVFIQQRFPLLFILYLPLLLLVWRHGLSGMVIGIVLLAATSGLAAVHGAGPFALFRDPTPLARMQFWNLYVAAACLLAYPTAIALTERRRLERLVQKSEARYRMLAEHSHDMIVQRRPDGINSYVSPASISLLGYAPDELTLPGSFMHPQDVEAFEAGIARLFAEGGSTTLEFRMQHRAGRQVWLEAKAHRVAAPDGVRVIYSARDVSQRVLAEQGQLASQAQLQALTDRLPAMVARFDRDVRFVYANERSRAATPGVDPIGKSLVEMRGETHYAQYREPIEAVLRGEFQKFDTFLDLPGGRVDLHAELVPDVGADGSVLGFYSLSFDITEAKQAERELARLARHDALTGLANRRHFDESLEEAVARAGRAGNSLLLLALDVDHFKQINDTLGHAGGDQVLREFARRVEGSVYEVDLVARLGGDEFVILVEFSPTADCGKRIAGRLLESMREPFVVDGAAIVPVTTSIGIGLQSPGRSGEQLMALADKALYEAKARGRNTWHVCSDTSMVASSAPTRARLQA